MKIKFCLLAVTIFILVSGYPFIQPTIALQLFQLQQSVWRRFTSPQGDYSILLPGEPTPVSASIRIANDSIEVQGFSIENHEGRVLYRVVRIDLSASGFPTQGVDSNQLLTRMQTRLMNNLNGQLISQRMLRLRNLPGRETKLRVRKNNQTFIVTDRVYLVGQKLYDVSVTVDQSLERGLARTNANYLDSFNLLTR